MLCLLWVALAALVCSTAFGQTQVDQHTNLQEHRQSIRHASAYEFIFEMLAQDIDELREENKKLKSRLLELEYKHTEADNRYGDVEDRVNDFVPSLNVLKQAQEQIQATVTTLSTEISVQEGCQSGRGAGVHTSPKHSFPYSATVKFNPPFKHDPAFVYGFYLLDATNAIRVKADLLQVSRTSFTINFISWFDKNLWGARISWMACPKQLELN